MPSAKEQIAQILQDQPDDSFYEEILGGTCSCTDSGQRAS